MNTQLTTLRTHATQKQGTGIASLTKMMAANGQTPADGSIASQQKTDNSGNQVNPNAHKQPGHNFNDTLRKKMGSETCEHAQAGNDDRQQKAQKKDKLNITVQDVPNPAAAMHDTLQIERVTLPTDGHTMNVHLTSDHLSPETPVGTPPLEPADASPVEIVAGTSNPEVAIPLSNDDPATPTAVMTDASSATFTETASRDITPPETGTAASQSQEMRQVSPQNEQNPVEPTQQIPAADLDQQEQSSEKAFWDDTPPPSDAKPSTETGDTTTPVTGKQMAPPPTIDILDPERPSQPLSDERSLDFSKKPVQPPQETPVFPVEKQEKTVPSDSTPPSSLETEVHSAQTSAHKMNVAMEQINSLKAEKQENSAKNKDFNADLSSPEEVFTDAARSSSMAEKSPVSGDPVKMVGDTGSKLALGRQIQESVTSTYRPGTQQIVIRLDPPELGRVTIRFIEQRDGITGILHVDKPDTKHEIQQTLAGIVQNLQNANIPIKKLEVVLNNQPQNNGPGEDSGNHHGNFEQRHSFNQNASENTASYHEWRSNSIKISNSTDETAELTDISINLLI